MAWWDQSEDKEILNCTAGQNERKKTSCGKHAGRQGYVSKHFLEILNKSINYFRCPQRVIKFTGVKQKDKTQGV